MTYLSILARFDLYMVLVWTFSELDLNGRARRAPMEMTLLIFSVALITTIRNQMQAPKSLS